MRVETTWIETRTYKVPDDFNLNDEKMINPMAGLSYFDESMETIDTEPIGEEFLETVVKRVDPDTAQAADYTAQIMESTL